MNIQWPKNLNIFGIFKENEAISILIVSPSEIHSKPIT
jgi:hypothetical protein